MCYIEQTLPIIEGQKNKDLMVLVIFHKLTVTKDNYN